MSIILGLFIGPFAKLFEWIPGLGPRAFTAFAGALVVFLLCTVSYMKGSAGREEAINAAVAESDLQWTTRLAAEKETTAHALADARRAAADVPATTDRAGRLRECGKSPTCRDRHRVKK